MFAKDFSQMTHLLEAAKLQGFTWDKDEYEFQHGDTYTYVKMELDEQTYLILPQRYRELFEGNGGWGGAVRKEMILTILLTPISQKQVRVQSMPNISTPSV